MPREGRACYCSETSVGPLVNMSMTSRRLGRGARNASFTNDRAIGVVTAGRRDEIPPLLDHVEGVTEVVTHPGASVRGYPR